jgi:hypothetical protein
MSAISVLIISLLFAAASLAAYQDENSGVVWIRCDDPNRWVPRTFVNNNESLVACHSVLNHFYERGYDVVGHGMGYHHERAFSWTLQKRRDACNTK